MNFIEFQIETNCTFYYLGKTDSITKFNFIFISNKRKTNPLFIFAKCGRTHKVYNIKYDVKTITIHLCLCLSRKSNGVVLLNLNTDSLFHVVSKGSRKDLKHFCLPVRLISESNTGLIRSLVFPVRNQLIRRLRR